MFGTGEMLLLVAVLLALVFSGVHIAVSLGCAAMLGIYLMTGDFQVVATFVGGWGHAEPLLGVAQVAARRGHAVTFAGQSALAIGSSAAPRSRY